MIDQDIKKNTFRKSYRAVILGAGRSTSQVSTYSAGPAALLKDPFGCCVMDWILNALDASNIEDITFVGGCKIEEVGEKYPKLKFIYNANWNQSGVLASLNEARSLFTEPVLVTYADIVYHPEVCEKIIQGNFKGITIAVDSSWRERMPNEAAIRKNLVKLNGDFIEDIGFLAASDKSLVEYIGLAFFGDEAVKLIHNFFADEYPALSGDPFEQSRRMSDGYMTDLLRYFLNKGIQIKAVDIGPHWAEMDTPDQLAKFVIGTKGETLQRLSRLSRVGKFCIQDYFTVNEWEFQSELILKKIQNDFKGFKKIAVRSSSLLEDSWEVSFAGAFSSVLDVDITDVDSISIAINKVIESYGLHKDHNYGLHQILVQNMVDDACMSGVVFTRDINTGAPYYIINYHTGSSRTDVITAGDSNDYKTIYIDRMYSGSLPDLFMDKLISAVREIETLTSFSYLDIEFAITTNYDVYILQARPLAVLTRQSGYVELRNKVELDQISSFLNNKLVSSSILYGDTTLFGDMPDWNPAEMIGVRPKPLAYSLYQYLITNSTWRIARGRIGYHDPCPATLMVMFAGHPYIDVRCSFNSLIPAKLKSEIANKLVNYYLSKLKNNPSLHDKVEFEVCLSCLDFNFSNYHDDLYLAGLSQDEIQIFRASLQELTNNSVLGLIEPIDGLKKTLSTLETRRAAAIASIIDSNSIPIAIAHLLDDCISYGTIPFAILARYAFIAYALLRSLVTRGVLSQEQENEFLRSISTVATDMVNDTHAMCEENLSLADFIQAYGHLRPGTYDINSSSYEEAPEIYFDLNRIQESKSNKITNKQEKFSFNKETLDEVNKVIQSEGFTFDAMQMFEFIADAIAEREYAKFEFTKTINSIFKLLIQLGDQYKLSREQLSYLNIETVRSWGLNAYPFDLGTRLEREIQHGQERFEHGKNTILPYLIKTIEDIHVVEMPSAHPNYVTLRKVVARIFFIEKEIDPSLIRDSIVLIESADPGYDWIFNYGITGLITKYGGAASHMTIRAAEFDIPAAIGVGEVLFQKLQQVNMIELDCLGKFIRVV